MTQTTAVKPHLLPRFCPQCGAPLIVREVEGRERRGCRRCGWVYEPQPVLAVTVVIEHDNNLVLIQTQAPALPYGPLAWGEDPAAAALRVGYTSTGLRLADPVFLGWVQTPEPTDPSLFVLCFCYVVQAEGPWRNAQPDVVALRLREVPYLSVVQDRYAVDAYRAWLERRGF